MLILRNNNTRKQTHKNQANKNKTETSNSLRLLFINF